MAYPTSRISINCPQCGNPLSMTVQQVVDVGEDPTLRERLLRGRLNVLNCPVCGARGPIAVPLVYHDPEKDLFLTFLPPQMQLTMAEEEKEIGRLTNLVLNHLPPEKRRGYLLNPVRVFSYDGLIEKILEGEGISPEEMQKQTRKIQLVMQMMSALDQEERLAALIKENREEIDRTFLMMLGATIQQAEEAGDEETSRRYRALQAQLVQQLELKPEDLPTFSVEEQFDMVIEQLAETPQERLQSVVAANRPVLDYQFFMHLTRRAEQASGEEKQRLLALRKTLVEMTEAMDKHAEEAMRRASAQLQALLQAEDIDAKIEEMYLEFDEAFLVVLSANVEQARRQGREDIAGMLGRIYERVIQAMEQRLRPELRAMNELLRMESSEERRARLSQELQTYNPAGFIEMIEAIAGDLEDSGRADPATLDRLYQIADEAREIAATMDFAAPREKLFEEEPAPGDLIVTPESARRGKPEGPGIILP